MSQAFAAKFELEPELAAPKKNTAASLAEILGENPIRAIPNDKKKITIRDFFVVNRDFFCRDSRQKYHESRDESFLAFP